ncbi:MAG: hypothetical protein JJ863_20485 [Deltaproteobacteria bacterium]|nr:hypothetical protein [Deltaproteobacteria bacterium]
MSLLVIAAQVLAVLTGTADTRALHADPDGTVWAGTTGGLVRGAGDSRVVFTPADGLPDGTVRALLRKGDTLWVGTDRGVAECTTVGNELHIDSVLGPRLRVEALAIHEGKLWLGTTTGLYVREGDALRQLPRFERVTALASAGDSLYVASPGRGVYQLRGQRRRRLRGDSLAWDLALDGDQLWVATSRGLETYRGARRLPSAAVRGSRRIPGRDLRSVRIHEGAPVVGSFGGGAWRFDGRRFVAAPGIGTDARVQALAVGPEGWIAGTPDGVVGHGVPTPSATLPDNDLSALARTREGLWIGTFDHGLVLLRADGSFQTFDEAGGLLDDRVNRLAVDADGELWVATDRGVVERQGRGFELRGLLDRHVFALGFVDGAIHAGAGAEVFAFIDGSFHHVDQPGERPQDFAERSAGGVLVASAEGLAQRAEGRWALTTSDEGLSDDWVTAVTVASDATYVGTYASGVARMTEERVEVLREDLWVNAGALAWLPNPSGDHLLAVGTLDDGLWLHATADAAWERIGTAQGLPDDDVTALLKDSDGTLWVATRGGLAHVDPR